MRTAIIVAALMLAAGPAHAQTAQRYAIECSTTCTVQSADADGNPVQVQQPAGYVTNIVLWDGATPYAPGTGLRLVPAGTLQIGQVDTTPAQ